MYNVYTCYVWFTFSLRAETDVYSAGTGLDTTTWCRADSNPSLFSIACCGFTFTQQQAHLERYTNITYRGNRPSRNKTLTLSLYMVIYMYLSNASNSM